jgi:2-haloacid dehalogenase
VALSHFTTVTFDCYGTLIDWEGGLGCFLYNLALRSEDPSPPNGRVLRERWEQIQFDLIQGPYQKYETILAESLRLWCAERGYDWQDQLGKDLARSMRCWQPFHDVKSPLAKARDAGLKLVIISNTDRAIIEHSLRHLDVTFDLVITAEDCGAYKPSLTVFEHALDCIGESPGQILHAAFGYKYDLGPAQSLGFQTVWIDRDAAPWPGQLIPDAQWPNLWPLYGQSVNRILSREGIEIAPRGKPRASGNRN